MLRRFLIRFLIRLTMLLCNKCSAVKGIKRGLRSQRQDLLHMDSLWDIDEMLHLHSAFCMHSKCLISTKPPWSFLEMAWESHVRHARKDERWLTSKMGNNTKSCIYKPSDAELHANAKWKKSHIIPQRFRFTFKGPRLICLCIAA